MDDQAEIGGAADRSSPGERRRNALVGIAVVVALALVVGAGVLIARSGEEGLGSSGSATYVLPPVDAEIIFVGMGDRPSDGPIPVIPHDLDAASVERYEVFFRDQDGTVAWLQARRPLGAGGHDTLPSQQATIAEGAELVLRDRLEIPSWYEPLVPIVAPPLDPVGVFCPNLQRARTLDGSLADPVPAGPPAVIGRDGESWIASIHDYDLDADFGPDSPPCGPDLVVAQPIVAVAEGLRVVDAGEWRAFVMAHRHLELPVELGGPAPSSSTPPPPSTTTTIPSVAIAREDEARAAVTTAVENFVDQDSTGAYVNIETGEDTSFWVPFFEEANRNPMATGNSTYVVTQVAFRDERRARVAFEIRIERPEQAPFVYPTATDVVRVGERWLVARASVVQLLNQAVSGDQRR
jgi:hypothetical protein